MCGDLRVWAWLSWVLRFRVSHEAAIKMSARPGGSSENSSLPLPLQSFLRWGFTASYLPLFLSAPFLPCALLCVTQGWNPAKPISQTPSPAGSQAGSSNGKKWWVTGKVRRRQKTFFFFSPECGIFISGGRGGSRL